MSENEQQSPYGRGFIAACIVVGAVLLCGVLLLISGLIADPAGAPSATSVGTTRDSGTSDGRPRSDDSATSAEPTTPGDPATPDDVATPGSPGKTADGGGDPTRSGAAGRGGCELPEGDQGVPARAPAVEGWDVSDRVVVPHSPAYGPAKTDSDGFRRCFAHSPTGALYAAYSAIAAIGDEAHAIPTVRKLMVPGPDTDALIRELAAENDTSGSETIQLAGFRFLDTGRDRVTVMLAFPVEAAYMSATLTLAWHDGDWRLQPPPAGEPVGSPFGQHRNLSDFVQWSGI